MSISSSSEPPIDGALRLVTLGDAALCRPLASGETERLLELGKPLALIIYLACSPAREARRDHLTDLLWAHMERAQARNALRQALWQIKSRIGVDIFAADRDQVALVERIDTDRDALLAAVADGDVERAVQLYTGAFVPGFAAPGGTDFEHWAEGERQHLHRVFLRSAEDAVQQRLATGRAKEAVALSRRARDHDPLNERTWRQLLEALVAAGDSVGALIEVDALAHLLEVETIDAEPATRSVMRQARAGRNGSAAAASNDIAPTLVADLVGREREFALAMEAWAAIGTRSKQFHIVAPAGLGKTRFLIDLHNRLRSIGAHTVYARADYGVRGLPYAFAGDLAGHLGKLRGARGVSTQSASVLVALNPSLSSIFSSDRDNAVGDEALRRRALALRELITAVGEERPIALLIDDLHWADAQSLRTIEAALGGIEKSGLLITTASRPVGEAGRHSSRAAALPLDPLSEDMVGSVVSSLADLPPEPWADRLRRELWRVTAGSPLLVLETLQLLIDRSVLARANDQWTTADAESLFRELENGSALHNRVAALDPPLARHLLILAVAGVPLDRRVLVDVARGTADDTNAAIAALEQRGFVLHHDNSLMVAHDEHAAASLETAPAGEVERIGGSIGRALLIDAGTDPRELRLAGSFLARASDDGGAELATVFGCFVRAARLAGDRTPNRILARQLLGTSSTNDREHSLIRSLSLPLRAGLASRRQIAATLAVGIGVMLSAVGAWTALSKPAPRPEAVLVAKRPSADRATVRVYSIGINPTRRSGDNTVAVDVSGRPRWRLKNLLENGGGTLRPDGRGWTSGVVTGDSGVIDVFDFGLDGSTRRLTYALGDDNQPSWAPDAHSLAFVTDRWSHGGRYDIAIYDTLTRAVRQLTQGPDIDQAPKWSPDGSRIAFERQFADRLEKALCVVDVDGTHVQCIHQKRGASIWVPFWSDQHRMVFGQMTDARAEFVELNWETGATTSLDNTGAIANPSPDGRFLLCECPRHGYPHGTTIVYPVGRPNDFTVVRVVGVDSTNNAIAWGPGSPHAPYIARLVSANGDRQPILGATHQLRVTGIDSSGNVIEPGIVRWRSEDTTVATVDSIGRLTPRRTGRLTIIASAGGWTEVQIPITISEPMSRIVFDEDWTHGLERWRAFGEPHPVLVSDPALGHAFVNNGDGTFYSGAYTSTAFDTHRGLWLETDLSLPISSMWSQTQITKLWTPVDSAAWAAWDHRTGDGPPSTASSLNCGPAYPSHNTGAPLGELIDVGSATQSQTVKVSPSLRAGHPFHVVIQIFPDGHCGVAIDNRVVWLGPSDFLRPSAHVYLTGNSVGTKLLVGHLRVGVGIAPAIDWNRISK